MSGDACLSIPRLRSGGINVTYRCTARCRHCLPAASPRREADYLDEATARRLLATVRRLGCRSVHVGGGEPFLDVEGLRRVLRAARAEDVGVEYVETNSSWYHGRETAVELLGELRDLGLDTLLVSISPFHIEHVPFARVRGVLDACREAGMSVVPWVESFVPDLEAFEPYVTHRLEELEDHFGDGYVAGLPSRYWVTMGGRAALTYRALSLRLSAVDIAARSAGGCAELVDTSHFHVDVHGCYVPGLCTGLAVLVVDLDAPLEPTRYPLLTLLHRGGVGALLDLAVREHGFVPDPAGYIGKCDLCVAVRAHLHTAAHDAYPELAPAGFYREL